MTCDPRVITVSELSINRLFFQAKNLAIEVAMGKIAKYCADNGFPNVTAEWKESSYGGCVRLSFHRKGNDPLTADIGLERDSLPRTIRPSDIPNLEHKIKYISGLCGRSAKAIAFSDFITSPAAEAELRQIIDVGCNYPFPYGHHSSF